MKRRFGMVESVLVGILLTGLATPIFDNDVMRESTWAASVASAYAVFGSLVLLLTRPAPRLSRALSWGALAGATALGAMISNTTHETGVWAFLSLGCIAQMVVEQRDMGDD